MKGGELMFMPKHMNHSTQGFTLMELLIVIGIIGILAVGLLAAVDPVEQLRRGRDTAKKNVTTEVANASARHYGVVGTPPWDLTGPAPFTAMGQANLSTGATQVTAITTLVTAGEL